MVVSNVDGGGSPKINSTIFSQNYWGKKIYRLERFHKYRN